jgi:hypothetical protein
MKNPEYAASNGLLCWALIVPRVNWAPQLPQGDSMAKGQQKTNKESKKPKKDTSPPKTISVDSVRPVQKITAVIPRGKKPV